MAREYRGWVCDSCGVFLDTEPLAGICRGGLAAHDGQGRVEVHPVTAIDSRDVEPLVEAARQILDPAETEDMSSSAWIDWAKRTARGALQPFTQENNESEEE